MDIDRIKQEFKNELDAMIGRYVPMILQSYRQDELELALTNAETSSKFDSASRDRRNNIIRRLVNNFTGIIPREQIKVYVNRYLSTPCEICSSIVESQGQRYNLPCGHVYHRDCLREYLEDENEECPTCGEKIPQQVLALKLTRQQRQDRSKLEALQQSGRKGLISHADRAIVDAISSGNESFVPIFIAKFKPDPSTINHTFNHGLIRIVEKGRTNILKLLLESGALDTREKISWLLGHASYTPHNDVVTLLLEAGADPNYKSHESVLVAAAKMGHINVVRTLLKAGADPTRDYTLAKVFMMESSTGKIPVPDIVQMLLDAGAKPNQILRQILRDGTKAVVPLIEAVRSASPQKVKLVKMLIQAGADVNWSGKIKGFTRSVTALEVAKSKGDKAIVDLLKAA